ncbi:hypothetical protein XaC1_198 [Xanthomonas phage XaC1]|nr:hypothetical protein XaC1_198 [Xanthomonas phage XaC1]
MIRAYVKKSIVAIALSVIFIIAGHLSLEIIFLLSVLIALIADFNIEFNGFTIGKK